MSDKTAKKEQVNPLHCCTKHKRNENNYGLFINGGYTQISHVLSKLGVDIDQTNFNRLFGNTSNLVCFT